MNIIASSILSIILSFFLYRELILKIIKDLADKGYKFKIKNINELHYNNLTKKNSDLFLFIPGINIGYIFYLSFYYKNIDFLRECQLLNLITEMSDNEKELYQKNPQALNALRIMEATELEDNLKENEIPFRIHFKEENSLVEGVYSKGLIIIKHVEGPLTQVPETEIIEKIYQVYQNMETSIQEDYPDKTQFFYEASQKKKMKLNVHQDLENNLSKNEKVLKRTKIKK